MRLLLTFILVNSYTLFSQTVVIFDSFDDSTPKWFNQRVTNAKKGKKEIVEMPLAVRSWGWGANCPLYFMSDSPFSNYGFWVDPVIPKTGLPTSDSTGHLLWVKGLFTGKMVNEYYYTGDYTDSTLYNYPVFKIISWKETPFNQ